MKYEEVSQTLDEAILALYFGQLDMRMTFVFSWRFSSIRSLSIEGMWEICLKIKFVTILKFNLIKN